MSDRNQDSEVRIPLPCDEEIIVRREPYGEVGVAYCADVDGAKKRNGAILTDEETEKLRQLLDG